MSISKMAGMNQPPSTAVCPLAMPSPGIFRQQTFLLWNLGGLHAYFGQLSHEGEEYRRIHCSVEILKAQYTGAPAILHASSFTRPSIKQEWRTTPIFALIQLFPGCTTLQSHEYGDQLPPKPSIMLPIFLSAKSLGACWNEGPKRVKRC